MDKQRTDLLVDASVVNALMFLRTVGHIMCHNDAQ